MNKLYSVHDHWTDIAKKNDVDIESIDGVITGIKVNGEDYGGGGSSDLSTAEVTIISELENIEHLTIVKVFDNGQSAALNTGDFILMMDTSVIYQVPLYKGLCIWNATPGWNYNVSTTGDITYDNGRIMIRGDGTITITKAS